MIEGLSKIIAKLPGMGPRIAKRIVLKLAENKELLLTPLIESLQELREKINKCFNCGNLDQLTSDNLCKICANKFRDDSIICIVEEVSDLWAIERSEDFNGKYHILGGNLSASSGKSIEDLNFNSLFEKIKNLNIKEVIIALPGNIDGQTTAYYIAENLKNFDVKITRLAHGIPLGSDLDYLDDGTISIAFKTRSEF
jgi:recombination protein RecR